MMNADIIEEVKEKIVKAVSPEKIILFGSYAAGTATEESDLDLVVIWNAAISRQQRNLTIRRLFPRRDFSLDVFVYTPEEERQYKDIKGHNSLYRLHKGKTTL